MHREPLLLANRTACRRLTTSCSIVQVRPFAGLSDLMPGQTLNVSLGPPGRERRISCFTVLQAQLDGEFSMLIRATGAGGVSDGLLAPGNDIPLWISDPFDTLDLGRISSAEGAILCIAGGSGASVLAGVAHAGSISNTDLVFVGRDEDHEAVLTPVLTAIGPGGEIVEPRRMTMWSSTRDGRPTVNDISVAIQRERYELIVACGPNGLCELVRSACSNLEIPAANLVMEPSQESALARGTSGAAPESVAVVDVFGDVHAVKWATDESLLMALLRAGIAVPYSCRVGICSTCQCSVLVGDSEMKTDLGLSDDDKAAGIALACQLRPRSPALAVRFAPS